MRFNMGIVSDFVNKALPVIQDPNNIQNTSMYKVDYKVEPNIGPNGKIRDYRLSQNVSLANDGMTPAELDRRTEGWNQYLKGKRASEIKKALNAREEAVRTSKEVEPEVPILDKMTDKAKEYGKSVSDFSKDVVDYVKKNPGTIAIPLAISAGLAGKSLYKYLKNKKKKQTD